MDRATIKNILRDGKITEQKILVPVDIGTLQNHIYNAEAILDVMSKHGSEDIDCTALVDIALFYVKCASELLNDDAHLKFDDPLENNGMGNFVKMAQ